MVSSSKLNNVWSVQFSYVALNAPLVRLVQNLTTAEAAAAPG